MIIQEIDKWCSKHSCSEFIIWMSLIMLIAKYAYWCNQGIMTKYSNLECNAWYITMIMMHCWDVWLQWWCNMRMRDPMHDWDDAYDTMQLPWCWPNDAYTMMQGWWYLQCMHVWNAWNMMHTLMSWWCIWLASYNRSLVTNTWVVLYPYTKIRS
jgi:hypothetical protein